MADRAGQARSGARRAALASRDGVHERGYWLDDADHGHHFDTRLARALCAMLDGQSVLDVGCGRGAYVAAMRRAGIDCDGVDGNPVTMAVELPGRPLIVADLSVPADLPVHDWAVSLEVGEHVAPDGEAAFVGNVHRHNRAGAVLSWASPGQGGRGHVNERPQEYVRGLMHALGYFSCADWEQALRQAARLPWLKTTIMVFRKMKLPTAAVQQTG